MKRVREMNPPSPLMRFKLALYTKRLFFIFDYSTGVHISHPAVHNPPAGLFTCVYSPHWLPHKAAYHGVPLRSTHPLSATPKLSADGICHEEQYGRYSYEIDKNTIDKKCHCKRAPGLQPATSCSLQRGNGGPTASS